LTRRGKIAAAVEADLADALSFPAPRGAADELHFAPSLRGLQRLGEVLSFDETARRVAGEIATSWQ